MNRQVLQALFLDALYQVLDNKVFRILAGVVLALVLSASVVWPWGVALWFGLDHYTMTAAMYLSLWTAGSVVTGIVWGLVSRRYLGGVGAVLLALLPALAGAGVVLGEELGGEGVGESEDDARDALLPVSAEEPVGGLLVHDLDGPVEYVLDRTRLAGAELVDQVDVDRFVWVTEVQVFPARVRNGQTGRRHVRLAG